MNVDESSETSDFSGTVDHLRETCASCGDATCDRGQHPSKPTVMVVTAKEKVNTVIEKQLLEAKRAVPVRAETHHCTLRDAAVIAAAVEATVAMDNNPRHCITICVRLRARHIVVM